MTFFLSPCLNGLVCDCESSISLKVHYEFILFLELIHILKYDS
jgi:hypothetical protein